MWNETTIAALKDGIERALSGGELAKHLSEVIGAKVTRNQVLGKAFRLGLSLNGGKQTKKPKKPREPRIIKRITQRMILKKAVHVGPSIDELQRPCKPLKSLFELKNNDCRWPEGDPGRPGFGFCGDPKVSGLPYCQWHARVAYSYAGGTRPNLRYEALKRKPAISVLRGSMDREDAA